jgi:serine/threonine-protein kinase
MVMETPQSAAPDGMIGQAIGHYTVRRKIGEGGMGSVYLAEHPGIGKRVALKLLHAEFSSQAEIVSRFFHEARAVNAIQHPNIVDIIDYGVIPSPNGTDPPRVYLLMEYLEGVTLGALIRREAPLSIERTVGIALQIADALAASHRTGIVHRDLKPDNVMIVSRGRHHELVKLLDFGVAKLTDGASITHRTRTGTVIGTPQYMAPEQCEGRAQIDHRADIYGLGIVVYEMLTGRVPFAGDGLGEVLVQQIATPPLAPSAIDPRIPEHVELVVLKALEKRADHRYAHMTDMALALQDPERYVETHGGKAGFVASPIRRGPAPAPSPAPAATTMASSPGSIQRSGPRPGSHAGLRPDAHPGSHPGTHRGSRPSMHPGPGPGPDSGPSPGRSAPTTLGGTAAQLAGTRPRGRGMRVSVALWIASAVAIAGAMVGVVAGGHQDPADRGAAARQPPPPPPPPPATPPPLKAGQPATVRVAIDSRPPGAIVRIDGQRRGTTPYIGTLSRQEPPVEIQLTLPGYLPATRKLAASTDVALSLSLDRAPPGRAPQGAPPPTPGGTSAPR